MLHKKYVVPFFMCSFARTYKFMFGWIPIATIAVILKEITSIKTLWKGEMKVVSLFIAFEM